MVKKKFEVQWCLKPYFTNDSSEEKGLGSLETIS
ncbi:hypothetical protein T01_1252 [Trichinella spiralis]|uniref:Uncharacterized protein n=1 Tax=Trichinella spiralis TaxID=6334 RepID=A0A0V0YY76_TRISP|nr:hypothetical protein T01_857 [Trichinella spiralis]KRY05250.1 hypothetical protein T01_1252 [Trichinella spiralis]